MVDGITSFLKRTADQFVASESGKSDAKNFYLALKHLTKVKQ